VLQQLHGVDRVTVSVPIASKFISSMGRTVDQDVHAAFVEFKVKGASSIVIPSIDCTVLLVRVSRNSPRYKNMQ
jgi:hypothetical protein